MHKFRNVSTHLKQIVSVLTVMSGLLLAHHNICIALIHVRLEERHHQQQVDMLQAFFMTKAARELLVGLQNRRGC